MDDGDGYDGERACVRDLRKEIKEKRLEKRSRKHSEECGHFYHEEKNTRNYGMLFQKHAVLI